MQTFDLLWYRDLRAAVELVERRLPCEVAAALADVVVTIAPSLKSYADAGPADIRLRPNLRGSMDALMGIVAHEAAHVYLGHCQQLRAGIKSIDQIEREADAQVLAWGFDLEHRRLFYEG